jgi:DNA primase catalytic core
MNSFDLVKDRIDFRQYAERHLIVKQKKALCVFHQDTHPSMHIYNDSFHCFTCHATGDVFDLHMKLYNVTKQDALIDLAREAGVTLEPLSPEHKAKQDSRARLYALMDHAAQFYTARLYDNDAALDYLCGARNLSLETIEAARIGYAPSEWARLCAHLKACGYSEGEMTDAGIFGRDKDTKKLYAIFKDRIMFPIFDTKGRVVGFTARAMGDAQPKYKNSPESDLFHKSDNLYGISIDKGDKRDLQGDKVKVIVEGCIDVLTGLMAGFRGIYACLGIGFSETQLSLLCQENTERLVFCLDKDAAGRKALRTLVEKHATTAANKGVSLYAMFAPYGKDPDDTFREKPELWEPAVDAAWPVVDVLIDLELASLGDRPSPAQLSNMARALLPVLKSDNPFVQTANIETLAARTGIAPSALQQWLVPQIHLLPKTQHVTKIDPILPSLEEWIIHSLIVNDDAYWFERANAALDTVTIDALPYALAPLSINDFTRKDAHMVMGQITRMVLDNDRPLYAALNAYFEGGNNAELYERLRETEARSLIQGGPEAMTYEEFISAVFSIRRERLLCDYATTKDADLKRECSIGAALLSLMQEEL